jgi:hypothetical protein
LDAHLYKLPDGYVAPTSNKNGRTWTEWFAGQKGDAGDQAINFMAGFADNVTLNASYFLRQAAGNDGVDYEGGWYSRGGWTAFAVQLPAGVKSLASGVNSLRVAANQFDDLGRCANGLTKIVHGGCFIEGTLVTVSSLPGQATSTDLLWSDPSWLDEPSQETPWLAPERYASVATRSQLQVPIESVPIGARVPTKNPNRSEVDPQPEPDQASWAKLSITAEGSDGGIVDAEIIRPRSWILASGLCAGRMLPLNLPELEVSGLALVTAIDDCSPIAGD